MPLILGLLSGEPAPFAFLLIFPLFWVAASLLGNYMLGIYSLFREYPADEGDLIEASLGWVQVEFGIFRGHTPMSLSLGQRALHLKGIFPFQPLFWLGPASIPWAEITQSKRIGEDWWRFWCAGEFYLGSRRIKLRGRAGRALQARLEASSRQVPQALVPR